MDTTIVRYLLRELVLIRGMIRSGTAKMADFGLSGIAKNKDHSGDMETYGEIKANLSIWASHIASESLDSL